MSGILKKIVRYTLVIAVFVGAYQSWKPMPEVLARPSPSRSVPTESVTFLSDVTRLNDAGEREVEQEIWDEIFSLIDHAEHFILLDMFLFNDFQGSSPETTRALSSELVEHLVARKAAIPDIAISLVTDPINTVYGGVHSEQIAALEGAGINVIFTDLGTLRDSNLLWSAFWRPFFSWAKNSTTQGWLPHPFDADGGKVTLRSWLALMNFKANHRKLIVADIPVKGTDAVKFATIVTSSNPHDGSSAHGNIAIRVDDLIWQDVISTEGTIAILANDDLAYYNALEHADESGPLRVTLLREEWIRKKALELIGNAEEGERIDLAMFYLSDRKIVRAIRAADARGVVFRLLLDPNKDAFGFEKNGIPNRPVARELVKASGGDITVRWCDTHGEQCHAKLMTGVSAGTYFLLGGSANFTGRNIGGYNLEADLLVEGDDAFPAWEGARKYFERLWSNADGSYSVDYEIYADKTIWKPSLYRLMERTGLSSF